MNFCSFTLDFLPKASIWKDECCCYWLKSKPKYTTIHQTNEGLCFVVTTSLPLTSNTKENYKLWNKPINQNYVNLKDFIRCISIKIKGQDLLTVARWEILIASTNIHQLDAQQKVYLTEKLILKPHSLTKPNNVEPYMDWNFFLLRATSLLNEIACNALTKLFLVPGSQ